MEHYIFIGLLALAAITLLSTVGPQIAGKAGKTYPPPDPGEHFLSENQAHKT